MVQCLRPYRGAVNYERWDKYGYNDKLQIVADTQYVFGSITGGVPQITGRAAFFKYQYDTENRIIHETVSSLNNNTISIIAENDFVYNGNGNLVKGATVYDNKLSIYRTNAVLMFITKDYSVNNAFTAAQYNDNALPLRFPVNNFALINSAYGKMRADYACH